MVQASAYTELLHKILSFAQVAGALTDQVKAIGQVSSLSETNQLYVEERVLVLLLDLKFINDYCNSSGNIFLLRESSIEQPDQVSG